ncbi:MAG: phosphopantetheine-binding protein, partial [Bacteroidota bacterium]
MIPRAFIEKEIIEILRCHALTHSRREISLELPLGDLGLGLDSLALIEFVTALEKRFRIEIPDSIWLDKGKLTLSDFVETILKADIATSPTAGEIAPQVRESYAANESYVKRIRREFSTRGILDGTRWLLGRVLKSMGSLFYEHRVLIVLSKDLSQEVSAKVVYPPNIVIRRGEIPTGDSVQDLWPPHVKRKMLRLLQMRHAAGYVCLTAWSGGEIVGIDWLSLVGDHD